MSELRLNVEKLQAEVERLRAEADRPEPDDVAKAANHLQAVCHGASLAAGWWPSTTRETFAVKLMLIVSEIAEAMEGDRKGLMDDKLPHREMREVELADALIRIFDLAGAYRMDIGGAVAEKLTYNKSRPDHKPEARAAAGGKAY